MRDITLRQRHPRSCGATCLAFIAGISLDDAERLNGTKGTSVTKMARSLRAVGFESFGVLHRITAAQRPSPGDLVKIRWNNRHSWHWVVKLEVGYFDPDRGMTTDESYTGRGCATSFLPVYPKAA